MNITTLAISNGAIKGGATHGGGKYDWFCVNSVNAETRRARPDRLLPHNVR
jgi:hypothetical protein